MRKVTPISLAEFETQPFRVSGSAELDADPLAVFAELGDPSLWFPLMRRSIWMTAATGGVGAERETTHVLFGRTRERMLAWDPQERVSYTMTEMTTPLFETFGEEWFLAREGIYTRLTWVIAATPSRLGRATLPAARALLKACFTRGCTNIQKRAGSYRGKQAS